MGAEVNTEKAVITVRVLACRGLRNADWSWIPGKKLSDAYVVGKDSNGAELFKTKTVSNSLEPIFDEEFGCSKYSPGANLELTVYDEDALGTYDVLGKVVLEHSKFKDGFNGEVELEGTGGTKSYIKFMVRVGDGAYPKGPPSEFTAALSAKGADLGLELDIGHPTSLYL